jgi:hypothetical protein
VLRLAVATGLGLIPSVKNQTFAALDWLPTPGRHRRRTHRRWAKEADRGWAVPGIVKTTLDSFDQRDHLEGKSEKSAHDVFFYYSGSTPSAVRYKNWEMYYTMSEPGAAGWLEPLKTYHFPLIQNIKRDPFEQYVAPGDTKSAVAHPQCPRLRSPRCPGCGRPSRQVARRLSPADRGRLNGIASTNPDDLRLATQQAHEDPS